MYTACSQFNDVTTRLPTQLACLSATGTVDTVATFQIPVTIENKIQVHMVFVTG